MAKGTVKANPTKAFFVRMITRDITLEDCILDLIDNSVDGAWASEGSPPMGLEQDLDLSPYAIKISATPDRFVISDNCGGMSREDAVEHAFSFGRQDDDAAESFSIGIYGIGMKRAVFKLGRSIKIHSTHQAAEGEKDSFLVPIDVVDWLGDNEPPWDFDIEDAEPAENNGVSITVENLNSGTSSSFDNPAFLTNLRRMIARDYSLHLHRGLQIELNGEPIVGWQIELLQGEDFEPLRLVYEEAGEVGPVRVEIIGGMGAPPPDSGDADAEDDFEKRFGWYVACNGRIVLAADKSTLTGWGDNLPNWHRQYSGFIGIILFTADNAGDLPLTTTKRSVDSTSEVFRRARPKMREMTRSWIDYTNARKTSLEEAKAKEAAAKAISIQSLPMRGSATLPKIIRKPAEPVGHITYTVKLTRLKALAAAFGRTNMSYRDVGIKSFEYTYDDMVGDD